MKNYPQPSWKKVKQFLENEGYTEIKFPENWYVFMQKGNKNIRIPKIKKISSQNGIDLQGKILRKDSIRKAIADFVKSKNCDIIVMGSRGTTNTPRMFLGTTAYEL